MSILRPREAFSFTSKTTNAPRTLTPSDLISSDDPDVKGKEHLFEPVEVAAARSAGVTETATAAPGELRSVPVKKAAPAAPVKPKAAE